MRKWIILGIALLAAIALGIFYKIETKPDNDTLTLYGNVDVRQVDISFRVLGRLVDMPFQEGDLVRKGELIATIEKQPYDDQVKQAEAQLALLQVSLKNAETNFKRRAELVGTQSVSKEDYENALYAKEEIEANIKASEALLGVAKKNLADTEVYVPNDGTILTRVREPGAVLNPTEPIYTISLLDPVWIRAFVSERNLGQVFPGMKAQVTTDTPGGKIYEGRVGFISPVAEFTPKTVETTTLRTDLVYRIRVYVDNPDWALRQGMPVTVKLDLKQEQPQRAKRE